MVRFDGEDGSSNRWGTGESNGIIDNPKACRCIADECAMWRWVSDDGDYGYCGLAGRR
jgi:hypothetical protein